MQQHIKEERDKYYEVVPWLKQKDIEINETLEEIWKVHAFEEE